MPVITELFHIMADKAGAGLLAHKLIGTTFGAGYCPVAPGTAGAAVALGVWLVLSALMPLCDVQVVVTLLTLAFFILGTWSSGVLEGVWGKDPSRVVVDETVGTWIALMAVPTDDWWYAVAAFVLFRFFDIVKPLGVRRMEALGGGFGIMMDDVLAGIYSAAVLVIIGLFV